jgi:hypothetical protein
MRQLPLVLVLLATFALTACGSDSGGDGGDDGLAALAGTWKTDCHAENDADGDVDSYKRTELVVSGSTFVTTASFFEKSDTTCATPRYSSVLTAAVVLGGEVAALAGTKKIDINPSRFEVTPATAAAAAVFNQEPYCDISDWAAGVKRDVTEKTCAGNLDTVYDIYKLDGNELVFGYADGDEIGSAADRRPKTLDAAHAYKKA